MRRNIQRWRRNIGGDIGRCGASPNRYCLQPIIHHHSKGSRLPPPELESRPLLPMIKYWPFKCRTVANNKLTVDLTVSILWINSTFSIINQFMAILSVEVEHYGTCWCMRIIISMDVYDALRRTPFNGEKMTSNNTCQLTNLSVIFLISQIVSVLNPTHPT